MSGLLWLIPAVCAAQFESKPAPPFILRNAATPEKHQIETMPGGVAVFDYDNDGRPDLFFTNGAPQPSLTKSGPPWWNRLYRNLGRWRFEDVTGRTGLAGEGYSMGAAAGDYDGDGYTDLLVTGVGLNKLYRNRGTRGFEDVTARAGIGSTGWSVSAGWFDLDADGDLDLWIVNYCQWDPKTEPFCGDTQAGFRTYCHPKYYTGLPNTLYRNNGDGTFTNVSREAGVERHIGKGMGVAFEDYDGDGRVDVAVTNDTTPNFLFRNLGGMRFAEMGAEAGIAMTDEGKTLSSMGVDFRDIDGDRRPDLFITALAHETFPVFRNLGRGLFEEITNRARMAAATLGSSGWSNLIADFDNDGHRDLFSANGDVNDNTELFSSRASRQRNQWFRNLGDGRFEAAAVGGPAMHRGAAWGDFDQDGALDLVVTRLNEMPLLLRNTLGAERAWVGFRLPVGARVRVRAGGRTQESLVSPAAGYLSSSEPAAHFGLGGNSAIDWVEVEWPDGRRQNLAGVESGHYVSPR